MSEWWHLVLTGYGLIASFVAGRASLDIHHLSFSRADKYVSALMCGVLWPVMLVLAAIEWLYEEI